MHACPDWPNPNHGSDQWLRLDASYYTPPTKYWVDFILTTAWQAKRFDSEREALACAQAYARLPNACLVVAYALTEGRKKIILEWSEA